MQQQELIKSLLDIAQSAGAAILEIYQREDLGITSKEDESPLTLADLSAHKVIVKALQILTPDIPVLSEESANIPWETRKQWQQYWLVDPLDGTKEFIKRNGEFTVNIALIQDGKPVIGVVYVPVHDLLYYGGNESGAFKRDKGLTEKIQTNQIETDRSELKVVASRSHRGALLDSWLSKAEEQFPSIELISMGSSLKICLVAEGKADIYPRLALTSEWDTAAAQAVLEAAGGSLVDDSYRIYCYNQKEDILNPFFYAIGDNTFDWQQFSEK